MKNRLIIPGPTSLICSDFLTEEGEFVKTVIISPFIVKNESRDVVIRWVCSRGEACQDTACYYSKNRRGGD